MNRLIFLSSGKELRMFLASGEDRYSNTFSLVSLLPFILHWSLDKSDILNKSRSMNCFLIILVSTQLGQFFTSTLNGVFLLPSKVSISIVKSSAESFLLGRALSTCFSNLTIFPFSKLSNSSSTALRTPSAPILCELVALLFFSNLYITFS